MASMHGMSLGAVNGRGGQKLLPAVAEEVCHVAVDDTESDCSTAYGGLGLHRDDDFSDSSSSCAVPVESLLIFDWDDTLFPTSWMHRQGLLNEGAVLNDEQWAHLQDMAGCVQATLETAIQLGHVVIVTNAQEGWVQLSCAAFMDSIRYLLEQVDIKSARSLYEEHSQEPLEWKRLAFVHEVKAFYGPITECQRNVVSFGDSLHEQRALVSVTHDVPHCCGKSVKFLESPTIEQLIEQHKLMSECFLDVLEHNGDLDVEIGQDLG
jgi:hypothetical protein